MLIGSAVCMSAASIVLALLNCFFEKKKTTAFLLKLFSLVALICSGILISNLKFNFNGYSILLFVSVIPHFINLFDIKFPIRKNEENAPPLDEAIEYEKSEICEILANSKDKQYNKIIKSIIILVSSFLVSFSGLYLGLETVYSFLLGVAIAMLAIFILLLVKKDLKLFDILCYAVTFLACGLLLGQILAVLLYSFSLQNILYSIGCIFLMSYAVLSITRKNKFFELIYFASMLLLFSTIIL